MVKKIAIMSLCLLVLGVSITAASQGLPQQTIQKMQLTKAGTFEGNIGYKRQGQNPTIVGTISGTYQTHNRSGIFTGDWATKNLTGTFKGLFGKNILRGRISAMMKGTEKTLPIKGYIKVQDGKFSGSIKAPVGPALYFWGTYT